MGTKTYMKYNYNLKRSKRKTLALEITFDSQIIVRAPMYISQKKIDDFVQKHEQWLEKHLEKQSKRQCSNELTPQQIEELKRQASEVLPKKVEYYSNLMQLYPTGVKITSAKRRFGSCNGKNSLCFSYRLMQYPNDAVDYVVVHELAHIKYKDHSRNFYSLIEQYMPDYKARDAILKNM